MNRMIACAVVLGLGAFEGACLDRPVATAEPLTKTNFSTVVAENAVYQLDILFDVDNSASMGDKQALLESAIPDLVGRLVNPNCIANSDNVTIVGTSVAGDCSEQLTPSTREFNPVRDMHLGIVSSSLGPRGGNLCQPSQMTNEDSAGTGQPFLDGMPSISSHTDDQGHLLGRSALSPLADGGLPSNAETETPSPLVGVASPGSAPQNFIDWFPSPASANDPTATLGVQSLSAATVIADPVMLETDFANLVAGVHAFGCGIESQLESWYRFLIQPDPYAFIATLTSTSPPPGTWIGYDQTIIQQRHDFLRPNSLVAIIVLSDENDSEIDARAYGGLGAKFMVNGRPLAAGGPFFPPPRGTGACATTPDSPDCQSCLSPTAASDPNCKVGPYTSPVDWGNDANLRHVHMKQKYGLDRLQYPLQRYYLGLSSPRVPDRTMEYPSTGSSAATQYQGGAGQMNSQGVWLPGDASQLNCTNPLFAPPLADGTTSLPDGSDMSPSTLCNAVHPAVLGRGRYTATGGPESLVFFAHIGGVPHQLLQAQPGETDPTTGLVLCGASVAQADCPQKATLALSDWTKILGSAAAQATPDSAPSVDPGAYAGIDPHMIEDYKPRLQLTTPTGSAGSGLAVSAPQPLGGGADPINGREWVTDTSVIDSKTGLPDPVHANLPVDREYACIFPLVDPTTGASTPRDCSNTALTATSAQVDYFNQEACDCSTKGLLNVDPTAIPAVCGVCPGAGTNACSGGGSDYNVQYYAKAYPTIREIELVHLMGPQGVLSSLCPIHASYQKGDQGDAVFGYRPAVTAIINRLKTALTSACLPERLKPSASATAGDQPGCNAGDLCVPCSILATLAPTDPHSCADYAELGLPLSAPSEEMLANVREQQGDAGSTGTVCQVAQIPYVAADANDSRSCKNDSNLGWCYVEGLAAGQGCVAAGAAQAIVFSQGARGMQTTLPNGSVTSLQCLEESVGVGDGG